MCNESSEPMNSATCVLPSYQSRLDSRVIALAQAPRAIRLTCCSVFSCHSSSWWILVNEFYDSQNYLLLVLTPPTSSHFWHLFISMLFFTSFLSPQYSIKVYKFLSTMAFSSSCSIRCCQLKQDTNRSRTARRKQEKYQFYIGKKITSSRGNWTAEVERRGSKKRKLRHFFVCFIHRSPHHTMKEAVKMCVRVYRRASESWCSWTSQRMMCRKVLST